MYRSDNEPVTLTRDVEAIIVPAGMNVKLRQGQQGFITQALGGSFTVYVEGNLFRISGQDADALGIKDQQLVWVASRRGKVISRANVSVRANVGAVYMTYQWWIGACNELTLDHLDPISRTPEYKYSAVKLEKIDDQKWAEQHVQQVYNEMKASMRKAALV